MIFKVVAAFILTMSCLAQAKVPAWAKDSLKRHGQKVSTVCSGKGVSVDSARAEALVGCKSTASNELSTKTRFKSLIVETESELALHSSSESDTEYKNLKCNQLKEEVTELEGQFEVWLQCEFNLSVAEVKEIEPTQETDSILSAESIDSKPIKTKQDLEFADSRRSILISTIPGCDSIIIKGKQPRVLKCDRNPASIIIEKDDKELIVRKNGYRPKTLKTKELLEVDDESFIVNLDK